MRTLMTAMALLLCWGAATPARAEEPKVGELHPEIRLPTIEGDATVSLRALRGKRVLLLQFASW